MDKCAPYVTKDINKPHAPWLNDDLSQAMRKRDVARNNLKRDRINPALLQQYTNEKKNVKSCITATKKEYYLQKLQGCKSDTSATWNIIKEIVPSQKKSTSTHDFENTSDKAEEFNNFFANVGENTYEQTQQTLGRNYISSVDFPASDNVNNTEKFRPKPVDTDTVILTIKKV